MGRTKITSRPKPDAAKAAAAKKKKSSAQVQSSSAQVQSSSVAVAGMKHHGDKNDCLDDEWCEKLSSAQVQSSSVAVAGMKHQGDKNDCSDDEWHQKKHNSDNTLLKHRRVVAEKRHSQKLSGSIQESNEESNKGDDSDHAASVPLFVSPRCYHLMKNPTKGMTLIMLHRMPLHVSPRWYQKIQKWTTATMNSLLSM